MGRGKGSDWSGYSWGGVRGLIGLGIVGEAGWKLSDHSVFCVVQNIIFAFVEVVSQLLQMY